MVSSPDDPKVFANAEAANGRQIDFMLGRFHSPLVGRGEQIVAAAKEFRINPVLLIAIMQQTTALAAPMGGKAPLPEWVSNPFAHHFNPHAKGVAKLRMPGGQLCSFQQSLRATAKDMRQKSHGAAKPLTRIAPLFTSANESGWVRQTTLTFHRRMREVH